MFRRRWPEARSKTAVRRPAPANHFAEAPCVGIDGSPKGVARRLLETVERRRSFLVDRRFDRGRGLSPCGARGKPNHGQHCQKSEGDEQGGAKVEQIANPVDISGRSPKHKKTTRRADKPVKSRRPIDRGGRPSGGRLGKRQIRIVAPSQRRRHAEPVKLLARGETMTAIDLGSGAS